VPTQESVKRSIANSAIGNVGSNIISLLGFIVLARVLTPEEFGKMAAITVLIGFSRLVIDLGLSASLIQKKEVSDKYYSTVFLFHILAGLLFVILMQAGSGLIEEFFGMEGLGEISSVCAWLYILQAITFVPTSQLEKRRQFRFIARIELYSISLSTLLAILLAWQGYGIWALVANLYCMWIVKVVLTYYFSRWMPRISISKPEIQELWLFSRYLFAMQVFNYATANLDKILIGRYLGAQTLGAYRYGDRIAQLPTMLVNAIFGRVLFPAFSSYQDDKSRIRYQYLKAVKMVSFITFPLLLGVSVISDHIVVTLLGEKWSEMIVILPLLSMSFLLSTIGVLNLNIYKALGRTKRLFKISLVLRLNVVVCLLIGLQYGLIGLLIGLLFARIVNYLPGAYIAGRLINVSIKDVILAVYKSLIGGVTMVVTIIISEKVLVLVPGDAVSLITVIAVGIIAYALMTVLIQKNIINEVKNLVPSWR